MTSVFYITRINFFSDKAHVYNIAKTCESLRDVSGAKITLVSTDNSLKSEEDKESFFKKNGVKNKFEIISLKSLSNYFKKSKHRPINWLETIFANLSLAWFVFWRRKEFDVLYFRDPFVFLPVWTAKFVLKKPVFFEIHAVLHSRHGQFLNEMLAKISAGLIVISHGLKDYYEKFNKNIIVSFCSSAEPERFEVVKKSKSELRKEINLPEEKIILGYAGNLWRTGNYDSYGVEDIVNAVPLLEENIIFVGVGKKGNETGELEELAEKLGVSDRVLFLPWVDKSEVAKYILSFDVLLVPSAGEQIGNSPTKVFEYLASGRPIVAANTRAISEILTDKVNALLVDYKKPESWSEAIHSIISDRLLAIGLVEKAKKDAGAYTWRKRAEEINSFMNQILK